MERKSLTEYLIKCKEMLDKGFKVLSTEYVNNKTKMLYQCPNGHVFERVAKDFLRYKTCPYCTGKHNYSDEEFKNKIKLLTNNEYEVISPYISTHKKVTFRHIKCGNTFDMSPSNFLNGNRCSFCYKKKLSLTCKENALANIKSTSEYRKEIKKLTNSEYSVLGKYTGKRNDILYKHNKCGSEFISKPDYFKQCFTSNNIPCPNCKIEKNISIKELELRDFIKSFYKKTIIFNDRTKLNGSELDIYLPEDNLAIEFNGLYWHSEEGSNGKCDKWYHYNKTKACNSLGIRLIHVFEDELDNHNEQIKSKIKYILHYSEDLPKIRASKCIIKEININDKNIFLDENHIQGHDRSTSYNLGLFYNDELVSVMTFIKMNNKYNSKNDYNLSRFASSNKYIINGAFSKLLKYFLNNYTVNDIYTFADLTWSIGNLYDKNNFEKVEEIPPDYSYYKNTEHELGRQHKFKFRKDYIAKNYPEIYDPEKTEKEMMKELGYQRIWNCGLIKYKYKRK